MQKIQIRQAAPRDGQNFAEWSLANPCNGFDSEAAAYPSSVTLCAEDSAGTLGYMPIQRPLLLESLAMRPGASASDTARALRAFVDAAKNLAKATGVGEIYFLGTEDGTNRLAENHETFERMPWPVYRLRVREMDKPNG